MPVIKALAVMKGQCLAMEAKMKIPRGGKRRQVQTKDMRSKVMIVREAGIDHI